MKIEIEDLHQYLLDNKDKISYVYLNWTWIPKTVRIRTNEVTEDGFFLYAEFVGEDLDDEYSFYGPIESAITYAQSYEQWNGKEFELYGPILMAYHVEDVWHMQEDLSSHDETDFEDMVNVVFHGFCYYGEKNQIHYYTGERKRIKDFEED